MEQCDQHGQEVSGPSTGGGHEQGRGQLQRSNKRPASTPAAKGKIVCFFCYRAKVGCSGDIPYARCCLMNLSCRPRGKAGAPIPEAVAAALAAGSIVNAVVASADVQACMELRLQVFHELHAEGRIIRQRAVEQIKSWRQQSLAMDSDVTWGFADVVIQTMGISAAEIEEAEGLVGGLPCLPPEARRQQAQARLAAVAKQAPELKAHPVFTHADTGDPMHLFVPERGGCGLYTSNDAFSQFFGLTSVDLLYRSLEHKVFLGLVSPSLVVPQDRLAYVRADTEVALTATPQATVFIKVFNGDVKLVIYRIKHVEVDGHFGTLLTLEEAPKSRHVTDRPELPFRVLSRFRSRPDRDTVEAPAVKMSQPGVASASARPSFPGLAVVPPFAAGPPGGEVLRINPARCLEIFGIASDGKTDGDGGDVSSISSTSHCTTAPVGGGGNEMAPVLPLPGGVEDDLKAEIDALDLPLCDPDWALGFEDWDGSLLEG